MTKKLFLFLIFLSIFFVWHRYRKDTIYIHPGPSWKKLFDVHGNGFYNLVHLAKKKGYKLREKRYVKKLKNAKQVIFFDHLHENRPYISQYNSILFTWEPPSVLPENFDPQYHKLFQKIYTWDDNLVDNQRYFKFHYPQNDLTFQKSPVPFEKKKLCTLINAFHTSDHPNELYSERICAIHYFEKNAMGDFDLFGHRWNREDFPSYRGSVPNKQILHQYRFAICYENIKNIHGYITEKIFDVMRYGCVPIYWGAENITDYIPANCFIDKRKFRTYEDLYLFMQSMTKDTYLTYLKNIEKFLKSPKAEKFSAKHFIQTLESLLDEK